LSPKLEVVKTRVPTLADNPQIYIKNRAARLARLVELKAPDIIIEAEFKMLEDAMVAYRKQAGYDKDVLLNSLNKEWCTYPRCKCIVLTSTTQPVPTCPKGLEQDPLPE